MNRSLFVGLMTLFICISVCDASAKSLFLPKKSKAAETDISFTVEDQQFMITDTSFGIHFSIGGGEPAEYLFEPLYNAADSGFVVSAEWQTLSSNDSIGVARPRFIQAGTYQCALRMRNTGVSDTVVSDTFSLTIQQISFTAQEPGPVCGGGNVYIVEIQNLVGAPNQIRLVVDSVAQTKGLASTEWSDFDTENPAFPIDITNLQEGVTISGGVFIQLSDSTTHDTTTTKVYATKTDTLEHQTRIDTTETATFDSIATDSTFVTHALDTTLIDSLGAGDSIFSYALQYDTVYIYTSDGEEIVSETIPIVTTVDSTNFTFVENDSYTAFYSVEFTNIARGLDGDYIRTKFDDCLIFVDNSCNTKDCQRDSLIFVSYQWYKNDEQTSCTEQYFYETDEAGNMIPLEGSYYVVATTADGRTFTLCKVEFETQQNLPERRSSIIYPNPAKEYERPTLHTFYTEEERNQSVLRIFDIKGELIFVKVGLNEYEELPMMRPNTYIILISYQDKQESIKFIVK
ncbi:MAG: T9SS type A sorting domain-containing protein [Paludibacteraceae bacterium]|nr:T9SS type A sorting domain-containing protein [Paludibacteraceae bacterium]